MNRQGILCVVATFRDSHAADYGITRIGLFGSAARDDMAEDSDVDIVVELADPDLLALIGIKQELEALLRRSADLVRYRESMNGFLKQRIEQEAVYV